MPQKVTEKPISRGRLRLFFGRLYYTLKRYMLWLLGGIRFAQRSSDALPHMCFTHETPLLRKLKDVDMQLQYNKIVNLKLALPRVAGVVLQPGEMFSFWRLIGKPTRRRGYLKGMVLRNGGFFAGTGGGLCQLSNLIYWMAIHTPLTIAERHRHSYDVFPDSNRTQPFGSGATCFYNYGDLMIRNDTQLVFRLELEVTDTHLKGAWFSDSEPEFTYEVYEKEHVMQPEFWGGYTRHNLLHRRAFNRNGVFIDDEFVVENHAVMMYSPLLSEHSD